MVDATRATIAQQAHRVCRLGNYWSIDPTVGNPVSHQNEHLAS
jgi:hypothetical protein